MACSALSLLFLCASRLFTATAKNDLHEISAAAYSSALVSGRTSLLYFSSAETSNNIIFLEELQKSATELVSYGIYVAKVNCMKDDPLKFCQEEKAYMFRGTKLLREFPTDTLFDVNAIIANVLFVLLYNEVKYITTIPEFHKLEDSMKGKKNVVFSYVQAIGTPEHRSVMEAVFMHGSTHQFILTTETNVLRNISAEDHSLVPAKLVFSHCQSLTDLTQDCPRTVMYQPMTALNINRFLKLMGLPLVIEASGDPDTFTSVHLQLGLPLVFILSQQENYDSDMETAELLAWELRGRAGVAILHREKSGLQIPLDCNVAVKRAEENTPVKFMFLEKTQQIVDLLDSPKEQPDKQEEQHGDPGVQDDEVAQDVYRNRKRSLPLQRVPELTDDTFKTVFTSTQHTAVLFYLRWDPVSWTVLESYLDIVESYKGMLNVSLSRVDCADFTYVCTDENITVFPTVKIYRAGEEPLFYTGMMGTEEIATFLMLIPLNCPLNFSTVEESEDYLNGKTHKTYKHIHNLSMLGIFTSGLSAAAEDFTDAGKRLRGFACVGFYTGDEASAL